LEKLAVYRAQREIELEEKRAQEEAERTKLLVIEQEKDRMLKEHGHVLN